MFKLKANCHCRNILVEVDLVRSPDSYNPRACDCDFCFKHGASYISDPNGALRIHIKDAQLLRKYRQGSETAEFLICLNCGVLAGVTYQSDGQIYAALNSRIIEDGVKFGDKLPVSPKRLGVDEKIARWKEVWFSNVIDSAQAFTA